MKKIFLSQHNLNKNNFKIFHIKFDCNIINKITVNVTVDLSVQNAIHENGENLSNFNKWAKDLRKIGKVDSMPV